MAAGDTAFAGNISRAKDRLGAHGQLRGCEFSLLEILLRGSSGLFARDYSMSRSSCMAIKVARGCVALTL